MNDALLIHAKDNVAVALRDFSAGETVLDITLKEPVPGGHKFAVRDIACGESVIKYAYPIGTATAHIPAGSHVHTHNTKTNLSGEASYSYHPVVFSGGASPLSVEQKTFMGYERSDGSVGTRNEIWIVPTVGCVNSVAGAIAGQCQDLVGRGIDAVKTFSHPYGCSQMGEDQENTRKLLAGLIRHPNACGVLVLGLGCENCNISLLKEYLGDFDEERIRFLNCQDASDEVEEGVLLLRELATVGKTDKRSQVSVSKLIVGLKCGGSDGYSGITANPTVGAFSDLLTGAGGSTILTEVPEMFGAETILMDRAVNEGVFEKTVSLINDFKGYFLKNGETVSENPSPGNKAGGITTLEDKSLGCVQKSGTAPVVDVLRYAQRAGEQKGLYLLEAPGNDLVASTALAASGAQLILFTTGRGTPFACPVPTMKISSNSELYERKKNWIDFDCGRLVYEKTDPAALSVELYEKVLAVAGGEQVKSETLSFCDLAIWKQGVTL